MKQRYNKLKSVALAALTMSLALGAGAAEPCTNCITFSAKDSFGIRVNKGKGNKQGQNPAPTVNLEYSTDQLNWVPFAADTDYSALPDGGTYKLHIRGTNNTIFAAGGGSAFANIFTNTADSTATAIACSGNIMTLLDYTKVAKGEVPTMNNRAFYCLFYRFTALTTAPELPAMTLKPYCYGCMFSGCTSLAAAPKLPATTLANYCYVSMFNNCTSLTSAPALPATTLSEACYSSMFPNCTSLTAAPELSATELAYSCYSSMFSGCTSLTAAPELPATELAYLCYQSMFEGCTSLTDVPVLDVVAVTNNCCKQMFMGCTNLMVNTLRPGKEWKIPENVQNTNPQSQYLPLGDKSTKQGWYYWATNMFANTAGDVSTGAQIVPGKTYYVGSKKAVVGDATTFSYGDQTRVEVAGELTKAVADSIKDQGITNLIVGADVTGVGDGAFSNWKSLREVTVGSNCASIGTNAFSRCYNLTNVTCEATNLTLGDYAFLRCNALQSLSFAAMPSNYDIAEMPFAFHAEINMRDGMPEVFAVPQITIGGYDQVLRGSTNLVDWVDVTTEKQRTENRFFKIVLRAK